MYHISEQGFKCTISVSRGSDVSFKGAGDSGVSYQ